MDYSQYATINGFSPNNVVITYNAMAVLAVFGIVGNLMSVVVWTRPQMKSSSAIMLTALGFCDIFIILCNFLLDYLKTLSAYDLTYYAIRKRSDILSYISRYVLPFMVVWLSPAGVMAQTASIYLTLAITVERFIAVCYPFQYPNVCSYSRLCKSTAIIIIFSILYNTILFWYFEVCASTEKDGTVGTYYHMRTDFSFNPVMIFYKEWLGLCIIYVIPLAGIIACNTTMCCKLWMASRKRRGLTDFQKKELRFTMLLVYVVLEFIVCYSITGFAMISATFNIHYFFDTEQLEPVGDFFLVFNSSVNFVTYITFGKPFRKAFLKTFSCCVKGWQRSASGNRRGNPHRAMYAERIHMMETNEV